MKIWQHTTKEGNNKKDTRIVVGAHFPCAATIISVESLDISSYQSDDEKPLKDPSSMDMYTWDVVTSAIILECNDPWHTSHSLGLSSPPSPAIFGRRDWELNFQKSGQRLYICELTLCRS